MKEVEIVAVYAVVGGIAGDRGVGDGEGIAAGPVGPVMDQYMEPPQGRLVPELELGLLGPVGHDDAVIGVFVGHALQPFCRRPPLELPAEGGDQFPVSTSSNSRSGSPARAAQFSTSPTTTRKAGSAITSAAFSAL